MGTTATNTTPQTVCVTGASGFIAAHAVEQLLQKGYHVIGTVRGDDSKYPYLTGLEGAEERLRLVQADLLSEGAFDDILSDCDYVLHTASPYIIDVKDPQRDLVDPAVQGTVHVLEACKKSPRVKRVILTSSIAAITDEPDNHHVFTEADWNTKSSLDRNPYYFSKTKAEQAAWKFMEDSDLTFDMVVINPFIVIGPSYGPSLNTSNQIIRDIMKGLFPTIMTVNWGFVDVRDVAKAHILAMETPEASGRYLCANQSMTMTELVQFLKDSGYRNYRLPLVNMANPLGTKVMKLLSYTQPKGVGTYMRTNMGKAMQFDNSKIKNELKIEFIPAKESILAAVEDMLKWKHLKAR
ncbi:SDR family oxidoreductase [Litoribrevibacter albus]|uniref:Dihydroflavonol-4-reductase n=1 Tax=Litoribrevibacter albus TaxID=1473156 RepID=A0AA37S6H3_9GAMM|nr:SDR family oxidoreductase [Litoribrevibacter albus]GLQ29570.1 dihydroflavonol-4-reductase [Litoribrevibacter albus]